MTGFKLPVALIVAAFLSAMVPAARLANVYAACNPVSYPPCPPPPGGSVGSNGSGGGDVRHKRPTHTPTPTATFTPTATVTPLPAVAASATLSACNGNCAVPTRTQRYLVIPTPYRPGIPPANAGLAAILPLLCVGGGAIGGLGLLLGAVLMSSNRNRGLRSDGDVASIKPRKDPTPEVGLEPNPGLNTSSLNLGGQVFPSDHLPQNLGDNKGDLPGLNRAFNRLGLPGIGGDGDANDGDNVPTGNPFGIDPTKKSGNIGPDGKDNSPYETGGWWQIKGDYVYIYGYYQTGGTKMTLMQTLPKSWLKDPNPMDEGIGGPGSAPRDGAGNLRPHGDVLGLEGTGLPGQPTDLHGNLSNLAHLNENANLGSTSGVGVQQGGATDPSGDADSPAPGDASQLKQILDSYDATYDPSPEHPVSGLGSAAKTQGH